MTPRLAVKRSAVVHRMSSSNTRDYKWQHARERVDWVGTIDSCGSAEDVSYRRPLVCPDVGDVLHFVWKGAYSPYTMEAYYLRREAHIPPGSFMYEIWDATTLRNNSNLHLKLRRAIKTVDSCLNLQTT
ncbi:hypothetical protein J6590_042302 [Homalodisca vitripennis]|nr:hypothetical protein J6590_042302 [Homalodisca vitripennis]